MSEIKLHIHNLASRPDNVPLITLEGCPPLSPVRIEQALTDDVGHVWRSYANMYADVFGKVSTAETPSQQGSYKDIDPTGLAWSMISDEAEAALTLEDRYKICPGTQPVFENPYRPIDISVNAYVGDRKVASATYQKHQISPDIEVENIDEQGIRGHYYAHKSPIKKEGVIVMGGSSGGLDHYWARHVASRGYNVLNLAYFNYPGLPDTCTNLPLEYFKTAIDWLKHRTGANRVGIQGASRGGEAVLLITTAFPEDIACTVSYVPMHITTGGFIPETTENVASWTLNGEDIPYVYTPVPTEEECRARGIDLGRGLPIAPFYYDFIAEAEKNEDMWIPIERSTAPLLMVTAKDDAIWACSYGAERVKERIAKYNGSVKAEHLAFDGAGHLMPPEGTITSLSTSVYHQHGRILIALGGTPAVNAHAGEKAWRRTIDFYAEHLL